MSTTIVQTNITTPMTDNYITPTPVPADVALASINQSNSFIAHARQVLKRDISQSRQLTLDSITAVAALSMSLYINNQRGSDYDIFKPNSTDISDARLRRLLANSIFNTAQQAELKEDSAGRTIYNKLRAGMIIFKRNLPELTKLWRESSTDSDFLSKTRQMVEGYGSLSKILKLEKTSRESTSNEVESVQLPESEAPETTNKSVYNKVQADFNHILNLLEKNGMDEDLTTLCRLSIAKIAKIAERDVAAKLAKAE